MPSGPERPLRADAARNAERLARAARAAFADLGPEAPLEEIAQRAGVRIRTLYNHFPTKEDLVRAALGQTVTEDLTPAIEQALEDDDPLRGLLTLTEAAMGLASRELNTLAAARGAADLTAEFYPPFRDAMTLLTRKAQDAGRLRADLVPEDLLRIMAMLTSTLWTMEPGSDGWCRYLAILFQGLTPDGAEPLTAPAPLVIRPSTGPWTL
jgi:AcrR family transcriptional regulator